MKNQLLLLAALTGALLAQTFEGTWQGTLTPANQTDGIRLAFKIDKNGNTYQGTNPLPLALKRATSETAWGLPPPPTTRRPLPEGTKIEFEVASIKPSLGGKPSPEGQPGNGRFNVTATELLSRNTSLADIVAFAFEIHLTQLSGLPGWAETAVIDQTGLTDRYDFTLNWRPDEFVAAVLNGRGHLARSATKAPADVLVMDKVSKPSEN